jgi:hypothetical protein
MGRAQTLAAAESLSSLLLPLRRPSGSPATRAAAVKAAAGISSLPSPICGGRGRSVAQRPRWRHGGDRGSGLQIRRRSGRIWRLRGGGAHRWVAGAAAGVLKGAAVVVGAGLRRWRWSESWRRRRSVWEFAGWWRPAAALDGVVAPGMSAAGTLGWSAYSESCG